MLSLRVKPISQAGNAARYYFSKDNYYFSGELAATWEGQSASKLGLGNIVTPSDLEMLLTGVLPTGQIVGQRLSNGEIKHRGGYDLTFSAPKSVSYLALVSGEKEFIDMHQKAVQKVLQIIEKEAAEARKVGSSGDMEYEKTKNLAFATILHDTSRDQDPLLHTHALMMNLTQRLDGKWRALASDIKKNHGTMEWVMQNQIFLGLVYRSEIAMGLSSMGLEIEQTGDSHGLFEIKNFSEALMSTFSKRRVSIEEKAKTLHSASLKAYDKATQDTRKYKKKTNHEALRMKWTAESQALGIEPNSYLKELKQVTTGNKSLGEVRDREPKSDAVKYAIEHLEERKLSFSYQELLQASLYFSLGNKGYNTLIQDIEREIKAGNLIALDDKDNRLTTGGLVAKEKSLIEQLISFPPQRKGIEQGNKNREFNGSTQNTLLQVLERNEGIVRIQQESITSKEVLLALVDNASGSKTVRVLTPSRVLAKSVNDATTKSPETVWQWLSTMHKAPLAQTLAGFNFENKGSHRLPFFRKEQELIIVDDVGRCTPDELNQFLTIASKSQAKVVLLEKSEGLGNFKSDVPGLLDKANVLAFKTQDRPQNTVKIQFHEAHDRTERLWEAASHYTKLSTFERKKTSVLTISKAESLEVNKLIRNQLKEAGELSTIEKELKTLMPVSLTASEKKTAKSYQAGWVLEHKSSLKSQKLKILSVDEKKGMLVVREESGRQSVLAASHITQQSQAYIEQSLPVSIGEQLVATHDVRREGIKAGTVYEVLAFTRYGLKLKSGGKTTHLLHQDHVPLGYCYAKNLHAHDYKRVDKTILALPSYALNKNTFALSKEISRQSLSIITDDVEKAKRHAKKLSVNSSAISIVLEASQVATTIKPIDEQITVELLGNLDRAITLLSKEKNSVSAGEKALHFAIAHLSEHEAVFSEKDLLKVALKKTIGKVNIDVLEETIATIVQEGKLLSIKNDDLTTPEAKDFEEQILSTVRAGKNQIKPALDVERAEEKLKGHKLTQGQKEACILIATTQDRFTMIQGYAGTGKTTMTKSVIEVIKTANEFIDNPLDIIAVAPTHQAVKEMRSLGISAQTLKSFLIQQEDTPTLTAQSLVLLDESSMVSNRDVSRLVGLIDKAKSRCTFLGDVSQHQAIESGKPSSILLQEGNIKTALMGNLVRQQVPQYKEAVETLIIGNTSHALDQLSQLPLTAIERECPNSIFKGLKTSVLEVGNEKTTQPTRALDDSPLKMEAWNKFIKDKTPLSMAVIDYLSRTSECREKTIIVIHENKHRQEANQLIREGLVEKNVLGDENLPFPRLMSTTYTTAELYLTETFAEVLKAKNNHYLKKDNQYFKVIGIDAASGVVELQNTFGEKSIFLPEKANQNWKVELFEKTEDKISVGEKIHFKKSDKAVRRFANEKLIVTNVTEDAFTVEDNSGLKQILKKSDLKDAHWDYSYTSTSYSIQGSSSPFVIGVANTGNKLTSHFRSFYIMVSRGSEHAMVYTDDYVKLKLQLNNTPNKTSALESLGLIPSTSKTTISSSPPKNTADKRPDTSTASKPQLRYCAKKLSENLSMHTEHVVQHLLGAPNVALSSIKELRYGTQGSLSISLQDDKRGTWFNFETGEKGNLLNLIQKSLGLDFKSSLKYAAKITGDDLKHSVYASLTNKIKPIENQAIVPSKTKTYAEQLSKESLSIQGTLAESYLKEKRCIGNLTGQDIRFHPKVFTDKSDILKYRPALLCIARDKENLVQSVQAIYLDKNTGEKAKINIQKKTFGSIGGAGVILGEGLKKDPVTFIAEGVETGLSVRDAALNERVIAVLGKQNMASIDISLLTDKVVLCLDNDGKSLHHDKTLLQAIKRITLHGKKVEIAMPDKKGDFNDVAKEEGTSGVIKVLNKSFKPESLQENFGRIAITDAQISASHEQIANSMKQNNQNNKAFIGGKEKTIKPLDLEIG